MLFDLIKEVNREIRIIRLKRKLRKAVIEYGKAMSGIDAGNKIAQYVSPRVYRAAQKVDKIGAKLKKLDPDAPIEKFTEE